MLIDAGCEIDCYASDITRTFPVSGRFSPEQKAIYELVLKANEEAFKHIAPGKHWNEAHEATVRVITAGLVELGLLQGEVDQLIASEAYKPSICIAPATGWAWTCTTSAITRSVASGACSSRAWR